MHPSGYGSTDEAMQTLEARGLWAGDFRILGTWFMVWRKDMDSEFGVQLEQGSDSQPSCLNSSTGWENKLSNWPKYTQVESGVAITM